MIEYEGRNYRTGFTYEPINLLGEFALRVSQTDADGNKKYDLITVCSDAIYFTCIFDKIKPYKVSFVQAYIGEEDYYINRFGQVYNKEFMEIRDQYDSLQTTQI